MTKIVQDSDETFASFGEMLQYVEQEVTNGRFVIPLELLETELDGDLMDIVVRVTVIARVRTSVGLYCVLLAFTHPHLIDDDNPIDYLEREKDDSH